MNLSRRQFIKKLGTGAGLTLLGSYPFFIEGKILQVNEYNIPVKGLPSHFNGFRIAHITDIHYGPLVGRAFVQKVVGLANDCAPDVTVCTGDYVQEKNGTGQIDIVWPLLAELKAKYGVFSVLGNHDHWADFDRSVYWLNATGQNLRHQSVKIVKGDQEIWFGGSGDLYEDTLQIDTAFSGVPDDTCKILLTHNPDAVDRYYATKINLAIAGHTHGGQVNIPFVGPPILPVHNKMYSSGYVTTPKTNIFISRGIGWAILPVRFNCLPEVAILHLFGM
jgi:predicted MPP superfamily phosphohydrolase